MVESEASGKELRALRDGFRASKSQLAQSRVIVALLVVIVALMVAVGPGYGPREWLVVGSCALLLFGNAYRPLGPRLPFSLERALSGLAPADAVHVAIDGLSMIRWSAQSLAYVRRALTEDREVALRINAAETAALCRALFAHGEEAWADVVRLSEIRGDLAAKPYLERIRRKAANEDLVAAAQNALSRLQR